ncbi:HEAT repeat domain-containing protein [Amphritea pacifica]|uniref:HEAT repeat domain-containing protein n=1 Tax=Amphritea pacifica TaxID=2811233 RepID=A0ABS2WDI5_9GAMM|nr:HEAT repeat domain-containing protein [Amphritea pacifica]MBN0989739.1 HEAT repeat domain-containing protein [Amphritea pacifica]MBN1007408.1 HEAT repeat domain-containing protein [Amphritea pacifica]
MFSNFDKYLGTSFSIDYWSDEGISHAAEIVSEFTEKDWEELISSFPKQSENWLVRCAESLGDVENNSSLDTLLNLLNSQSEEVQIAALDSMNALLSSGVSAGGNKDRIKIAIKNINSESTVANMMLKSLGDKLS